MSFSRRFRRHAHRVASAPRRGWRRTIRYRRGTPGWFLSNSVVTPVSEDARYGDHDDNFWDWMRVGILAVIGVGVAVPIVVGIA
jgi:hypothetical protein